MSRSFSFDERIDAGRRRRRRSSWPLWAQLRLHLALAGAMAITTVLLGNKHLTHLPPNLALPGSTTEPFDDVIGQQVAREHNAIITMKRDDDDDNDDKNGIITHRAPQNGQTSPPLIFAAGFGTTGTRTMFKATCKLGLRSLHYQAHCGFVDDDQSPSPGLLAHAQLLRAHATLIDCVNVLSSSMMRSNQPNHDDMLGGNFWCPSVKEALDGMLMHIDEVLKSADVEVLHDTPYPEFAEYVISATESIRGRKPILLLSQRNWTEWAAKRVKHEHDLVCKQDVIGQNIYWCLKEAIMRGLGNASVTDALYVVNDLGAASNTVEERDRNMARGLRTYQEYIRGSELLQYKVDLFDRSPQLDTNDLMLEIKDSIAVDTADRNALVKKLIPPPSSPMTTRRECMPSLKMAFRSGRLCNKLVAHLNFQYSGGESVLEYLASRGLWYDFHRESNASGFQGRLASVSDDLDSLYQRGIDVINLDSNFLMSPGAFRNFSSAVWTVTQLRSPWKRYRSAHESKLNEKCKSANEVYQCFVDHYLNVTSGLCPNYYVRMLNGIGDCVTLVNITHLERAKRVLNTFDEVLFFDDEDIAGDDNVKSMRRLLGNELNAYNGPHAPVELQTTQTNVIRKNPDYLRVLKRYEPVAATKFHNLNRFDVDLYEYAKQRFSDEDESKVSVWKPLSLPEQHQSVDNEELDYFDPNSNLTGAFANCTTERISTVSSYHLDQKDIVISCETFSYRVPKIATISDGLFIGVLSSAGGDGSERRQAIRETWGLGHSVYFIVAGPWDDVSNEYQNHKDLIWLGVDETYDGENSILTHKTMTLMKVAYDVAVIRRLDIKYFFKTDDDSFVNVDFLRRHLTKLSNACPVDYFGSCTGINKISPQRTGVLKWSVSFKTYPEPFYPRYCHGSGYAISLKFLSCAIDHIANIRLMPFEDVATGLLGQRCGFMPTSTEGPGLINKHRTRLRSFSSASEERERVVNNLPKISKHKLSPPNMENRIVQHRIYDSWDMREHYKQMMNPQGYDATRFLAIVRASPRRHQPALPPNLDADLIGVHIDVLYQYEDDKEWDWFHGVIRRIVEEDEEESEKSDTVAAVENGNKISVWVEIEWFDFNEKEDSITIMQLESRNWNPTTKDVYEGWKLHGYDDDGNYFYAKLSDLTFDEPSHQVENKEWQLHHIFQSNDVLYFDLDVLRNIQATYEGASSYIEYSDEAKAHYQSVPLHATIDRRPIIVRKQMMLDGTSEQHLTKDGKILGCAISSNTFVSNLNSLSLEDFDVGRWASRGVYNNRGSCGVCFQFSNRQDMSSFVQGAGYENPTTLTKCFEGNATIIARFAEWQQKDDRFTQFGYPFTVDCILPNGISELACEEITRLHTTISERDDLQSIHFVTSFMLKGHFGDEKRTRSFKVHSKWPWNALTSHNDDRSVISHRLATDWKDGISDFVPQSAKELNFCHVEGPGYEDESTVFDGGDSLQSTVSNLTSRGGISSRLLATLFHLIRNSPGSTHMIAVVDGQISRSYDYLSQLLDTKISLLYPNFWSVFGNKRELETLGLIPISTMGQKGSVSPMADMTLIELLRLRKMKIHMVPILTPSLLLEKSVCGGQYQFTTYLAARFSADYHAMAFVDSDTALVESSMSLQDVLYSRFFHDGRKCAGHRLRLIEQFVEPQYEDRLMECVYDLSSTPAKWEYAMNNCHLNKGHIFARTDSIYAFSIHHPDTLPEYLPRDVHNCVNPGENVTDMSHLDESEVVQLHLRDRVRKPECSCFKNHDSK